MSLLTVPSSFITEFLRWLVKERGYVSHHEIMEKLNVGYLTARKLLEPLERSGDIVCVGDTCFDSSSVLVLDLRFNRGFAALRSTGMRCATVRTSGISPIGRSVS